MLDVIKITQLSHLEGEIWNLNSANLGREIILRSVAWPVVSHVISPMQVFKMEVNVSVVTLMGNMVKFLRLNAT